jgi:hypothetical protein
MENVMREMSAIEKRMDMGVEGFYEIDPAQAKLPDSRAGSIKMPIGNKGKKFLFRRMFKYENVMMYWLHITSEKTGREFMCRTAVWLPDMPLYGYGAKQKKSLIQVNNYLARSWPDRVVQKFWKRLHWLDEIMTGDELMEFIKVSGKKDMPWGYCPTCAEEVTMRFSDESVWIEKEDGSKDEKVEPRPWRSPCDCFDKWQKWEWEAIANRYNHILEHHPKLLMAWKTYLEIPY